MVHCNRAVTRRRRSQGGQAAVEYAVTSAGVLIPVTFMLVFTAQLLWTWHSGVEWTREGARYAATHCFQNGGDNVRSWMRTHVPPHMDQQEFSSGTAEIFIFATDTTTDNLFEQITKFFNRFAFKVTDSPQGVVF